LEERLNGKIKPGPLLHIDGRILGEHKGIPFYTIGQRKMGYGGNRYPLYVIKIDKLRNAIILGEDKYTYSQGLIAENLNFLSMDRPKKTIAMKVKIRYNHREVKSRLIPKDHDRVEIEFSLPQRAVTPGQSVVFYDKDIVLGGGIISESVDNIE
jgi:tRNA-specific 2-thiouridylase